MKAYAVLSWDDTEYYLSKQKAQEKVDELMLNDEPKNKELEEHGMEPKYAHLFEIDIQE